MSRIKAIPAESLVYIDECGIDQYLFREYAYAPRGEIAIGKINGKKYSRTNIVAGICQGKWVAPMDYGGTTDSRLFEYWFENCLLKEAKEGSVFVLDNSTFHKKNVLPVLAEKMKCTVLFLPPYSPDLNPIEQKWAWLKRRLRKILPASTSFDRAFLSCF